MKIHESITMDRVADAIEDAHRNLTSPGFCISCGEDADGVEPDARGYKCECCEENSVYGAEELLFHLS